MLIDIGLVLYMYADFIGSVVCELTVSFYKLDISI